MKPQLVLMRILRDPSTTPIQNLSAVDPARYTGTAQWDVNHAFHLAALEAQGILQTYMLETSDGGAKAYLYPCVAFQLHLSFGVNAQESGNKCGDTSKRDWDEEFSNETKAIKQPWGSFEFIPKRPGEIIFFQAESSRILFAQLPGGSPRSLISLTSQIDEDRTKVYCVGRHSSTILSIAVKSDGLALASAARDGCLRIWRLSDGSMIAQTMFARWRQPRNLGVGRVSPRRRQNDEVDCAYPALRVVCFSGKSWDVAMGCPSGEARTWSMQADEVSPLTIKNFAETASLFSGKSPISSLALHVPDSNFPLQEDDNREEKRASTNFQERIAVGTSNGRVQVWTKHKVLGEWASTWSTTASAEGASLICLSFRADGGLLAAAASFLSKQLTQEEAETLLLSMPPTKLKKVCERVYLYETYSWDCVGTLNFTSQIGCCLFYRPRFQADDKKDPRSIVSREKVSSCRVLLVSTADGPQAHILQEHGVFGYRTSQVQRQGSSRKETKTVSWADLKKQEREAQTEHPKLMRSSSAEEIRLWSPNTRKCCLRKGTGESALSALRSRSRTPPRRPRSSAVQQQQSGMKRPLQEPSMLSVPADFVGTPNEAVLRFRPGLLQRPPPQSKSRKCLCCSKQARSEDLPDSYPMDQVVQKLGAAVNQAPSGRAPPRKSSPCEAREVVFGATTTAWASSYTPSPLPSRPLTPQLKKRARNAKSFRNEVSSCSGHDSGTVNESKCAPSLNGISQSEENKGSPPDEYAIRVIRTDEEEEETEEALEELTISDVSSHNSYVQKQQHYRVLPGGRQGCFRVQQFGGGKENLHDPQRHTEVHPHLGDHYFSNRLPQQQQQLREKEVQSRHLVGGAKLPDRHIVGGLDLEDFITRSRSPFAVVKDQKLVQPEAFSTTKLLARLSEIEQETFDVDAALQVAKLRGIALNKEDEMELKKVFEKETRQTWTKGPHLESERPSSARYTQLKKINDPKIAHPGPFLAPRRVKKQVDPKWEDMRTLKPSLSDLWDIKERMAQVCPSAPADIDHKVMHISIGVDDELWAQREATCRHSKSSQATYDSCLYMPDQENQDCPCNHPMRPRSCSS